MEFIPEIAILLIAAGLFGSTARAEQSPREVMDRDMIVQKACEKEIDHARSDRAWVLRMTQVEAGVTRTFQRVETSQGDVQRLVAINGKPATGPAKDRNETLLHTLWADSTAHQKQISNHETDTQDQVNVLRRIPLMYIFRDEESKGVFRRVHFSPNPNFTPANYKERVLHTLEGDLLIDPESLRFVEVDATVTESFTVGFGLLGYLKKGGSIHLRREVVAGGAWKSKTLSVDLDGKLMLLKDLGKHQSESFDEYYPAPSACDLLCGLRILGVD